MDNRFSSGLQCLGYGKGLKDERTGPLPAHWLINLLGFSSFPHPH